MTRTEIRVGGLGGQGIILCGSIIGKAAAIYAGKHAAMIQAFGPEARGSACSAQVIVSDEAIGYPYVRRPDVLVLLSQDAFLQFASQIKPDGLVLYEEELVQTAGKLPSTVRAMGIPATRFAEELETRLAGAADRLENGNVLVAAGVNGPGSTSHVFEVAKDDGEVVWDFTLPEDNSMYRAERITPPLVQPID